MVKDPNFEDFASFDDLAESLLHNFFGFTVVFLQIQIKLRSQKFEMIELSREMAPA